ncbi:MAG: CDP-glycerol glycerophosphotransferase family protein [Candidatus Thorarchaeota archaeon]
MTGSVVLKLLRAVWKLLPNEPLRLRLIGKLVKLADFLYPKDDYLIVFGSNSGRLMTGSPLALFEYVRNHSNRFRGVFFQREPKERDQIGPRSLRHLLTFLSARYIVSSHGLSDFSFLRASSRKVHVATWHGIIFKGAGFLCKLTPNEIRNSIEYSSCVDIVLSASVYDAAMLCFAHRHPPDRPKLTGHPRNDQLLRSHDDVKSRLKRHIPRVPQAKVAILYAPTFRDSSTGSKQSVVKLFPFDDFDERTLSEFLESHSAILLVRKHIHGKLQGQPTDDERVFNFGFDVCPDVNSVLSDIDILVTDYSSIAYDFLLLDRPIVLIPYDLEEFQRRRGFVGGDYEFWAPGKIVRSMREFMDYVEHVLSTKRDPLAEKRRALRRVLHSHQTANSCHYVLEVMEEHLRARPWYRR